MRWDTSEMWWHVQHVHLGSAWPAPGQIEALSRCVAISRRTRQDSSWPRRDVDRTATHLAKQLPLRTTVPVMLLAGSRLVRCLPQPISKRARQRVTASHCVIVQLSRTQRSHSSSSCHRSTHGKQHNQAHAPAYELGVQSPASWERPRAIWERPHAMRSGVVTQHPLVRLRSAQHPLTRCTCKGSRCPCRALGSRG